MLDCKEYEKLIPDFLSDSLDDIKLEKFISHIENCPECMEELSIQFLITEGMNRLEEGGNFELAKELGILIEDYKDWIYFLRCKKLVRLVSSMIGLCAIVAVLCMVIIL